LALAVEEEHMHNDDCREWITQALEAIPWDASPILAHMRQHYGEAFMQRLRDMILLPLLGYRSIRDAEEDLPYGRDGLYEWMKLEGCDWFDLIEEVTFALFFYWLEYGHRHDPSTLSRNRVRMIFDHTLIQKWGRTIADIANLYDHVSGSYQWSHKLVVCLVTVGEGRARFPLAVRLWSKTAVAHQTHSELGAEICDKVHHAARERGVSLASVRVLGDKDYCTKAMRDAMHRAGMVLWSSPQPTHKFTWQGHTITKADLESHTFDMPWRQSSQLRGKQALLEGRYARFVVEHGDLGTCVLAVEEYVEVESHKLKRRVYLCTDPRADAVRVIREAKNMRWPIEPHFRQSKQTGSYGCYQGTQRRTLEAHYACAVLGSILLEELLRLSRRRPSLSQGKRMRNTSEVAWYLNRNVRFDTVYKSESFLRLRRGSLKGPPGTRPQKAKNAA
jgi:hypothetical protein